MMRGGSCGARGGPSCVPATAGLLAGNERAQELHEVMAKRLVATARHCGGGSSAERLLGSARARQSKGAASLREGKESACGAGEPFIGEAKLQGQRMGPEGSCTCYCNH